MRFGLMAFLLAVAAGRAGAGEGAITLANMVSWRIVCDPAATESERYAALSAQFGVTMDTERTPAEKYINEMRTPHAGMKAVELENETWRLVLLPESNAKIVEVTYKPTGRNVLQPTRVLDRFRHEEWVRAGEGPGTDSILPHEVQAQEDRALLAVVTKDGARIARSIVLDGDTIRLETQVTAGAPRI